MRVHPGGIERNRLVEFSARCIRVPVEVQLGIAHRGVTGSELRIKFECSRCSLLGLGERFGRWQNTKLPRAEGSINTGQGRMCGRKIWIDCNRSFEPIERLPYHLTR